MPAWTILDQAQRECQHNAVIERHVTKAFAMAAAGLFYTWQIAQTRVRAGNGSLLVTHAAETHTTISFASVRNKERKSV